MSLALQSSLDALTVWRRALDRSLAQLATLLDEHGLLDDDAQGHCDALRQRLASDRLVVAFVAEFSRGKSELINALFFADAGRRVMPATPGRTTMCPVELAWDPQRPPGLMLLPIDTRVGGQPVAAMRQQPALWQQALLPMDDPDAMAAVLEQVTHTRRVPVDTARALGLWHDERPDDNPPEDMHGLVEVPAWRHALINYPHPLLKRGLVVIDTPGLNAIGAEPELTLGLLPSADATVYLLAADTGVTRSDMSIWRDHLSADNGLRAERFVVLNKIDTLADPLLEPAQIEAQIQRQQQDVALTLGVEPARVFPISARLALTARVHGDPGGVRASRLPALEAALQAQLLPRRADVIAAAVVQGSDWLQQTAQRRLNERQHQTDEQRAELQSLRGKSGGRVALMSSRLQTEATEFERCVPRLAALRVVLTRQLQEALEHLGAERVRTALQRLRETSGSGLKRLGAGRVFAQVMAELRQSLLQADGQVAEIEQMLGATQRQINAEFGFSLGSEARPSLAEARQELDRIEGNYGRYLGITQLWRQAQPGFMNQFVRMLQSKLRVVFENAAVAVELWVKTASSQMDEQLRERRRSLAQRRESFARIQGAESELDQSIAELDTRAAQLQRVHERLLAQTALLHRLAAAPGASQAPDGTVDIELSEELLAVAQAGASVRTTPLPGAGAAEPQRPEAEPGEGDARAQPRPPRAAPVVSAVA